MPIHSAAAEQPCPHRERFGLGHIHPPRIVRGGSGTYAGSGSDIAKAVRAGGAVEPAGVCGMRKGRKRALAAGAQMTGARDLFSFAAGCSFTA